MEETNHHDEHGHNEGNQLKEIKHPIWPDGHHESIKENQLYMSTWALVGVLIVAFFLLKSFIYIADEKRKGK